MLVKEDTVELINLKWNGSPNTQPAEDDQNEGTVIANHEV